MSRKGDTNSDRFSEAIFKTVGLALSHDLKKPIGHNSDYMSLVRNRIRNTSTRIDASIEIAYLNAKILKYDRYAANVMKSLQLLADRFKSGASISVGDIPSFTELMEKSIVDLNVDISEFVEKATEISSDSEVQDYIKIIGRNRSRITDQYEGLKELLGAVEKPQLEEVNLLTLTDLLVSNYRKLLGDVTIELSTLDRQPPLVSAVRGQILAAIQNLLENAIRFSLRSGERQVAITLNRNTFASLKHKYSAALQQTEAIGAWIELHVRNRGTPVKASDAEQIFILFMSTENRLTQNQFDGLVGGGSGIGLTVSRAYITAHRGVIFLNTENRAWTDFVVLLPNEPMNGVPLAQLLGKYYSHVIS